MVINLIILGRSYTNTPEEYDLHTQRTASKEQGNYTNHTLLPHIKSTTDKVGRIPGKHDIRTTHKPDASIRQLLENPKR